MIKQAEIVGLKLYSRVDRSGVGKHSVVAGQILIIKLFAGRSCSFSFYS